MKFDLQDAKDLVSNAKYKETIEYLLAFSNAITKKHPNILDEKESTKTNIINKISSKNILLVSARLATIEEEFMHGFMSINDKNIELNKIGNSLLSIIDQISQEKSSRNKKISINNSYSIDITYEQAYLHLQKHLNKVNNWSKTIFIVDSGIRKRLLSKYISLDYYAIPKNRQTHKEKRLRMTALKLLKSSSDNILLLGQPGSGKTTTVKKILQDIIRKNITRIPILLRFRDFNNEDYKNSPNIILLKILKTIGISIIEIKKHYLDEILSNFKKAIETKDLKKEEFEKLRAAINKISKYIDITSHIQKEELDSTYELVFFQICNQFPLLIILEGLDEIEHQFKNSIIREIERLLLQVTNTKILITSRLGEINHHIDNLDVYELCPLSAPQIKKFSIKWLGREMGDELINSINNSPFYDTATRPLTLSHLCAIYERYQVLPQKPKDVYRRVVNLLIEDWDLQRNIIRSSKFEQFTIERKKEFLTALAYHLTTKLKTFSFSKEVLFKAIDQFKSNFGLNEYDSQIIIEEIENHTGLFVKSGYKKYEFSHKSIQEYLCANYILRLPNLPNKDILYEIPSEAALVVALSSNATYYLEEFIRRIFRYTIISSREDNFISLFFTRLILENPDFKHDSTVAVLLCFLFTIGMNYNKSFIKLIDELFNQNESVRNSFSKIINDYKILTRISASDIERNQDLITKYALEMDELKSLFLELPKTDIHLSVCRVRQTINISENENFPEFILIRKNWLLKSY